MTDDGTLYVKLLDERAIAPTVAHPGEDLAYDLYALEDTYVPSADEFFLFPIKVRTGVTLHRPGWGFIIKDRSSMAARGVFTHGGVIDSGYRGEILVMITSAAGLTIKAGDKIAQLVPVKAETDGDVLIVDELPNSSRGTSGFGSSGR